MIYDFIEPLSKMERLDKNQWKQYQNMMNDSGRFVELLHQIEWEEGLAPEVMQGKFFVFFNHFIFL
jgi:hypothetical protein